MRLLFRFAVPLFVVIGVMAAALTPVANGLIVRWFERDVEMRSRLIFETAAEPLAKMVLERSQPEIETLFDRIASDERVLAVGWCGADGRVRASSRAWPRSVACGPPIATRQGEFRADHVAEGSVLVARFPLNKDAPQSGTLVIIHDLRFVADRSLTAWFYLMAFLGVLGIVVATVTLVMARLTLRRWIESLHLSLRGERTPMVRIEDRQMAPVIGEIRQLLRDLEISRRTSAGIKIDWSADSLRQVLEGELPGVEVLVLSNREPYSHNRGDNGTVRVRRPASGLVTALEPIVRACRGTWVAHGSGSADRETTDEHDRIQVPPGHPAYTLRRVWLSDEEVEGYYNGFANEGLWPLCHITFVRPVFREPDWNHYVAANRKFADALVAEAKSRDPVVLVQDYHFALAPRMIRERLPEATIITFWHIPWPNSEVFGICPWREEILEGLLGSTIIGFHTQLHCNNFLETADRFLECHIDREDATVSIGGQPTLVRPYPISIAWPPEPLIGQPPVEDCRNAVLARYGLPPDILLGVGVERFDFTKGIPDRFRAVEILLEQHPEWIGRFVLLQVAAPSRSTLRNYQDIQKETQALAEAINARFGHGLYKPILLVIQHHEPEQVYELFRAADIFIVSSLHDGMNLVAKEFVAARDDEHGVLILSSFAGASRELMEALIVNPFDARATADAIDAALRMAPDQQAERMRLMRSLISENNIYYWAGRMLLDAARIRKRGRIESSLRRAREVVAP